MIRIKYNKEYSDAIAERLEYMGNHVKNGADVYNELYASDEVAEKKAKAFDKIAAMFYAQNFGSASKAEIELLMFSIFMDAMIEKYQGGYGTLDYNACSDYKIGAMLGIPQERVRTLKVKKQARYPQEFDWKNSLISIKNEIIYDDSKKKIIIPVRDPNLYNEIRNFIEDEGGYIEIQRGTNILQMRPEYFFILLYKASGTNEDKETIRKEFAKKLREHNENVDIDDILTDSELSQRALEYGDNFFDLALSVAEGVSNPLVGIIKCIQCLTKFKQIKG